VHPLPLYEAALLFALAFVFALLRVRGPGSGRRVLQYAAAYSALRFALELLRGDDVRGVFFGGALSTSQLIAAAVLTALAFMHVRGLRAERARA
jgi:prolipoprotein diacylglyceryltransferase